MAIDRVHAAQIAMGSAAVKDVRYARAAVSGGLRPSLTAPTRIARSWLIGSLGLPGTTDQTQAHHPARLIAPFDPIIRLA